MLLAFQQISKFGSSGGFTRALKTHEHDDVGDLVGGKVKLGIFLTQKTRQLVHDDLDDVLGRSERVKDLGGHAALGARRGEVLHHFEVDVSLKQRHADLAHGIGDVLLGKATLAAQTREYSLKFVGKRFEHVSLLLFPALPFAAEVADEVAGIFQCVEVLKIVHPLAYAEFQDGQLQLMGNGQGNTALRRAVELGDDHAVKIKSLVELARLIQTVLACGSVNDQHIVDRHVRALAHHIDNLLKLAHEVGGGMKPAGGVDENLVGAQLLGARDGVVAYAGRVGPAFARAHLDISALSPNLKLLDGSSAERVGTAQNHGFPAVVELLGDFPARSGFARTIDAHEKDDARIAVEDAFAAFDEQLGDLVVQKIENRIGVGQRLHGCLIAQILDDASSNTAAHIGQDQRFLKTVPKFLVKLWTSIEDDVHALPKRCARPGQTVAESSEKTHVNPLLGILERMLELLAENLRNAVRLHGNAE